MLMILREGLYIFFLIAEQVLQKTLKSKHFCPKRMEEMKAICKYSSLTSIIAFMSIFRHTL